MCINLSKWVWFLCLPLSSWMPLPLSHRCSVKEDNIQCNTQARKLPKTKSETREVCVYVPRVCLFVGCLTSQQPASVSQGRMYKDNFTCCHTEIQVADQTFYPTQSQYTDTRPTSPSADPIAPGKVAIGVPTFKSLVWLDPEKSSRKRDLNPGSSALEADTLTTWPLRRYVPKDSFKIKWTSQKDKPEQLVWK